MAYKCLSVCLVVTVLFSLSGASTKKGVGISWSKQYHCTDEYKFNNVHWWYTWEQRADSMHFWNHCNSWTKPGFIPMVNGRDWYKGINISENAQYVLGFNEPDHHDQSNLTVAQAVPMWKELEKKSVGKVLVSPAVTNLNWLALFFQACHDCRVDHVAVHIYSCDPHFVMNKLQTMWNKFHKPIWLTEFACPHTDSADDQLHFMKQILPMLEAAPHVFRYAWFVSRWLASDDTSWVRTSCSLLKPSSPDLTPLGHYYNNFL